MHSWNENIDKVFHGRGHGRLYLQRHPVYPIELFSAQTKHVHLSFLFGWFWFLNAIFRWEMSCCSIWQSLLCDLSKLQIRLYVAPNVQSGSFVLDCHHGARGNKPGPHGARGNSHWTALKTSSHLRGKCKIYKPVWRTTCCSFPTVPSSILQIGITWIYITKKSADSNRMSAFNSAACMRRQIGNRSTGTLFPCHSLLYGVLSHICSYLIPL